VKIINNKIKLKAETKIILIDPLRLDNLLILKILKLLIFKISPFLTVVSHFINQIKKNKIKIKWFNLNSILFHTMIKINQILLIKIKQK